MMEQFSSTSPSSRVKFDEEDNNGLVLGDKYLPVKVLIEIFCHADCETLLSCQLVCRRWKMLMNHVWHKKTERTLGKSFPWNDKMPWTVYYLACTKKPYERNLVKNHSGAMYMNRCESRLIQIDDDRSIAEERSACIIGLSGRPRTRRTEIRHSLTYYEHCTPVQTIVLEDEGIHSHILDIYQPPIEVSEWYGCEWECPVEYQSRVKLLRHDDTMIDEFLFRDVLEREKLNRSLKQIVHEFKNYGPGLRRITFERRGLGSSMWEGRSYSRKMAGARVCVRVPEKKF